MENKTNTDRGEIIDTILINDIHSTPIKSLTDQLYRIGENEAYITIQCTILGYPISSSCIKHTKFETKYLKFNDPNDALFISNACKQRLAAQTREQEKIEKFTQRYR